MTATHSLRDELGRVLIPRGKAIETAVQLSALQARGTVYIDFDETAQARQQLVAELDEMTNRDAPLSDFASFVPPPPSARKVVKEIPEGNLVQSWSEIETRLTSLLGSITAPNLFGSRTLQLTEEIRELFDRDRDASMFLLLGQSISNYASYSASHSLLCAVLCEALADLLSLPASERKSLSCAALTMNVAMTTLQDQLALQRHPPSPQQNDAILAHAARGRLMLARAGVNDELWLDIVACHHEALSTTTALAELAPVYRLARLLQTVDRYTATMSPRKSRTGRTARDSARTVIVQGETKQDEAGTALVRTIGLSPPGTYVRLITGEVAVVLRRGAKPNCPIVAVVLNKREEPIAEAKLVNTARTGMGVHSAVSASEVRVRLNQEVMLKLLDRARTEGNDPAWPFGDNG